MKAVSFIIFLGATVTAIAQSTFHAALTATGTSGVTGAAAFILDGTAVSFTISVNFEDVVPTSAQLISPRSSYIMELGTPFIRAHSPGPWPNGYDGSTAFFGSFTLPLTIRDDFIAGRTVLELRGTRVGDLSGPVLPASGPQIASFVRQGVGYRIGFTAQAPYQYSVEYISDLGQTNVSVITNVPALSQTFDVIVTDNVPEPKARFYRLRRELCCH